MVFAESRSSRQGRTIVGRTIFDVRLAGEVGPKGVLLPNHARLEQGTNTAGLIYSVSAGPRRVYVVRQLNGLTGLKGHR